MRAVIASACAQSRAENGGGERHQRLRPVRRIAGPAGRRLLRELLRQRRPLRIERQDAHAALDRAQIIPDRRAADMLGANDGRIAAQFGICRRVDLRLEGELVVVDDDRHARQRLGDVLIEAHDRLRIERHPHRPAEEEPVRAGGDKRPSPPDRLARVHRGRAGEKQAIALEHARDAGGEIAHLMVEQRRALAEAPARQQIRTPPSSTMRTIASVWSRSTECSQDHWSASGVAGVGTIPRIPTRSWAVIFKDAASRTMTLIAACRRFGDGRFVLLHEPRCGGWEGRAHPGRAAKPPSAHAETPPNH